MPVIQGGTILGSGGLAHWEMKPIAFSGVPTSGGSGTGVGIAEKGQLLVNTLTGIWYTNTGTLASPTWTVVGAQT